MSAEEMIAQKLSTYFKMNKEYVSPLLVSKMLDVVKEFAEQERRLAFKYAATKFNDWSENYALRIEDEYSVYQKQNPL